jgi:hypothetical protein
MNEFRIPSALILSQISQIFILFVLSENLRATK